MATVLVTGGTGFIGSRLCEVFHEKGHDFIVLSRRPDAARSKLPHAKAVEAWEPDAETVLPNAHCVVHLAGETVASKWNSEKKRRIRESRVLSTRSLVASFSKMETKPEVFVCASAIGYYGAGTDEAFTEESPVGSDFLAEVCQAWEAEAQSAEELGIRVVRIRIGLVLGANGGALQQMLPPFKMGVGGRLGSGNQWMSWVHIDDVVGIILYALENCEVVGALNATAPEPVRNTEFTKTLGHVLHRPTLFPVPSFALKLRFGEFTNFLLMSQRVLPERTQAVGYEFRYTKIEPTLQACLS